MSSLKVMTNGVKVIFQTREWDGIDRDVDQMTPDAARAFARGINEAAGRAEKAERESKAKRQQELQAQIAKLQAELAGMQQYVPDENDLLYGKPGAVIPVYPYGKR